MSLQLRGLLSCLLLATAPALAATPPPESIDKVFSDYGKDGPGCALAVVRDGAIAYSKGYGLANVEHGVPITPQTVFDIGSTSKQITAASILLLAQDGKLSLDDDVRKHIPEMPDFGTPVTLRHLLHHTSGVRDYITLLQLGEISFEDVATDGDALAALSRQKALDFRPGDEHGYSNSGYFLLSLVVKRTSGKTLREFAQERIFTPLGMTSTQILDDHTLVIPRRAASYAPRGDGGFRLAIANWEQTGDGAVQTTVEDLAKWDRNFYDPKVGGPALIEQLQVKGVLNDGSTIPYARGLVVDEHWGLRRVLHGGGWAGYRAEMIRFPDERLSVITLCNRGDANPTGMAMQVAELYLADRMKPAEPEPTAAAATAPPSAPVDAARYGGLFWNPLNGTVRRIYGKDGKLFYERGQGNESELAPLGGDRFALTGGPAEVLFPSPREMHVLVPGDKPAVFQKVEPFAPAPAEIAAYAGTFYSEELDITFNLSAEEGRLVLRTRRQSEPLPLDPVFANAFRFPGGPLLRFTRAGDKVTGFTIDAGRARNLGFSRVSPVSRFGEYKGYSELVYDSWERTSFHIPARDGTRLAVDLFRPTRGGEPATERLPVVWTANRYQRAGVYEGKLYTILDSYSWMADLIRHGYVVAVVDVRGAGASFGTFGGMFTRQESQDSYDVTEWLGTQPWSNGKVGMYGGSYLGFTQYMAAGQVPPHLAAIVPEKAGADLYALLWNGGILRAGFIERWTKLVRELDVDKPAPPVDGPEGEALLRAAVAEHRANRSMAEITEALPFRDSVDAKTGIRPWLEWSPITYRKEIERSGVAIYHLAGWFDRYVLGQLVLFKNLDNPQRITIGPWSHVQDHELDSGAEHRRFYDYWLKGIDNGIMKEDPVHYYVMGKGWRSAREWPLPEEKRTSYWFAADGRLTPEAPPEKGRDTLAVDYSASVWPAPRWSLEATYPDDLSANDAKGITYTTPPLTETVEVTGHPVVRLWVSTDAADADLFVYLEEVDAKGASHYVTEGSLRASLRATADPGFDYLGMPWHRSFAADAAPLPKGKTVELAFDLFPTSNLFDAGHRIRVTVTGSDKANGLTPEQTPPPRLNLHREDGRASHIVLPIIPAR